MSSEQKKDYKKMYLQTKRRYQELKQQNGGFWGKAENETVPKSEGGSGKSTSSKSEVAQLHEKVLVALEKAHNEALNKSSTDDGSNKEITELNKQLDETQTTIKELKEENQDLQNKLDIVNNELDTVNQNFNENTEFLNKQIDVLKTALESDKDNFKDEFEHNLTKLAAVTVFIKAVEDTINPKSSLV